MFNEIGCERLAKSVVDSACIDYMESSIILGLIDKGINYRNIVKNYKGFVYKHKQTVGECLQFFRSERFDLFTSNIDTDELLKLMNEQIQRYVNQFSQNHEVFMHFNFKDEED